MVAMLTVKNHKAVVEGGGFDELKSRVLFVELSDFVGGDGGGRESENSGGDTFGFVGENIKSVDVDVAINEDNLGLGLANHFDEEAVGVVNLPLKEDFLTGAVAAFFFNVVKNAGEASVVFSLVF